jgi:rhomboid protease GluP
MNTPPPSSDTPPTAVPGTGAQQVSVRLPEVRPMVTYTILGLTVIVFFLQMAAPYLGFDVTSLGDKNTIDILNGQLWRLFTPMLLHASIAHIGFNMYALFIFGPRLERYYGHWRFLLLYLISGFAGNVMSFLFTAGSSVGASTAIFGLLAAEGVFLYQNRKLFGNQARRELTNIVSIAVINLIIGLTPGIDNWGHIGGILGGALFAWTAGPLFHIQGVYPSLSLEDERGSNEAVRTGLSVVGLFALLAAVRFFLK